MIHAHSYMYSHSYMLNSRKSCTSTFIHTHSTAKKMDKTKPAVVTRRANLIDITWGLRITKVCREHNFFYIKFKTGRWSGCGEACRKSCAHEGQQGCATGKLGSGQRGQAAFYLLAWMWLEASCMYSIYSQF